MACKKALEILPDCVCASAKNLHNVIEAKAMIRTAVMSKQYGNEDFLADLIAQACGESCIYTPNVYLMFQSLMCLGVFSYLYDLFITFTPNPPNHSIDLP